MSFDPYQKWLGIAPEDQPPDYYNLLGVKRFESNIEAIKTAAANRVALLQDVSTGKRVEQSQRILNEVAHALVCLSNIDEKRAYDARLRTKRNLGVHEPIDQDATQNCERSKPRSTKMKSRFSIPVVSAILFVGSIAAILGLVLFLQSKNHEPASLVDNVQDDGVENNGLKQLAPLSDSVKKMIGSVSEQTESTNNSLPNDSETPGSVGYCNRDS